MTIRRRGTNYEITVYVGPDPITGKERRVSRTVPGKPGQRRIPPEVLQVEAKLRIEVARGHHRVPGMTVGELLDRWFVHARPNLAATTLVSYQRCIERYLRPELGTVRLGRLTTATVDGLYRRLLAGTADRGELRPATIRQAHAVLRRALRQAVVWGWIERNVAADASPPRITRTAVEAPGIATVRKILAAADADSVDLGDLIHLAGVTGARRGEVCGLRWTDVTLSPERGSVLIARAAIEINHRVSIKGPKHGVRAIPIGPRAVARLKARRVRMAERALACGVTLTDTAYVLSDAPDGSVPLNPNLASDRFRRLVRKLDLTVRLHDLRHGSVTAALEAGHSVNDVAAFHGHESPKMTLDVYGHAIPAGMRGIADTLDRRLG